MALKKIAIAQIDPTLGDLAGNAAKIESYVEKAKQQGAQLVVFPELVLTGYPPNDLLLNPDFVRDTLTVTKALAERVHGITAVVGSIAKAPLTDGKSLYNAAIVMENGIRAVVPKTLLPLYDVFYEPRYFVAGKERKPVNIAGTKVGLQICEDMWDADYATKVTAELAGKGAELMINISASPFYAGKIPVRYNIAKAHAEEHSLPFLYVNLVGAQDDLVFDGGSFAVNAAGSMSSQLPQFKESLTMIDLGAMPDKDLETMVREEELFNALVLGVKDYCSKNHIKNAVLGVSGGIDSALTAVVAAEALGAANVKGFALPSQFNTSHAMEDAKALVHALGMPFDVIPIGGMYNAALDELARTFAGKPFDVTEENIQARLRMLVLMSQVNKHGGLLLSTGDKSELALGYCTLYGDLGGGLSVISDLTKPEVYAVSRWYNAWKGSEVIPKSTLTKPPSPELKQGQVAPFNYDRVSPIIEQLVHKVPIGELLGQGHTIEDVRLAYDRMRQQEFKRYQAPIGLKLKQHSFGRGRLMPVSNHYVPALLDEAS